MQPSYCAEICGCVTALLVVVGLAAPAHGQGHRPNASQIPQGSPFNDSSTENVDSGDVDLDGDFDAVFAGGGDNGNDRNCNQGSPVQTQTWFRDPPDPTSATGPSDALDFITLPPTAKTAGAPRGAPAVLFV